MNITFVGSGYVGLVSGTIMSHQGYNITCLDNDEGKITNLNNGILPIHEPGLEEYVKESLLSGRLKFTSSYDDGLKNAEAVFITVGTPPKPSGEADLQYIYKVIDNIVSYINKDCLIVIKSTVPPTTCNEITKYIANKGFEFNVASNPEFLREASAIKDFLEPDRIVVGVSNKQSEELLRKIYAPWISKNIEFFVTNTVTAEMVKNASNGFLATKIAYNNEMANLCEKVGANIKDLSAAMGLDKRIGEKFLQVGPGFGGSCFPKDTKALADVGKQNHVSLEILEAVIKSNEQRPYDMVDKIIKVLKIEVMSKIVDKIITVLGLTYKAGTDDVRDSPAIKIIKILLDKGAHVQAFDPMGLEKAKNDLHHKNLVYVNNAIEACTKADVVVIATEWPEFKELDWQGIYNSVTSPIIVDLRNTLDAKMLEEPGFEYHGIGQGT